MRVVPEGMPLLFVVTLVLVTLVTAPTAQAHGPCRIGITQTRCLDPRSGEPGTRVTINGTLAYRAVWNENVVYGDGLRSIPLAPIAVLVNRPRAREKLQFVVPEVEPGTYPISIYDGAEVGGHYTWDVFTVTDGEAAPRTWAWIVPLVVVGFLGVLFITRRRSDSHGRR